MAPPQRTEAAVTAAATSVIMVPTLKNMKFLV